MPDIRDITVKIPALSGDLHFVEMEGHDALGECFEFRLVIAVKDITLKPEDALGTKVVISVAGEPVRHFHGLIAGFGLMEVREDYSYYRVVVRPWLWFLSLSADNRIFQNMSAVEIIEDLFAAHPDAKFDKRLQSTYPQRVYCVQYGESDLDFVQRLMEDEGIGYFFEHAEEAHTLVLFDTNSKLVAPEAGSTLPYKPDGRASFREGEFVTGWLPVTTARPGKFAQTDYDFEKPSADLMTRHENQLGHEGDNGEVYLYPGVYTELGRGDARTTQRLEERQSPHIEVAATATARGLWSGHVFTLDLFPAPVENDKHIVLRVTYRLWDDETRRGGKRDETGFEIAMRLMPSRIPFRPERRTPRPVMKGPQTAVVVGPSGAEIFTDKYARVKVQFHWDRKGGKDENSTCFIRVSQTWAGAGWGFIQIPRIGQEVIVDFLEGDPDQPIITGRVYNAEQMPPYGLPGSATQSGWKSNSSPGGGGFNELRFEDKSGSEEVYFQAQKDHNELIKNNEARTIGNDFSESVGHDAKQDVSHDRTESVGNDKATSVGNNRTVSIGVNDTETVGSNRSLSVGSNETINVGANSSETIGANHSQTVAVAQTITVGAARTDTVGGAETRTVGAVQTNTIGSSRSVTVGSGQTHAIGADDGWTVGAGQTVSVGADQSVTIGSNQTLSVGADQTATIGANRTASVAGNDMLNADGDMGIKVGKKFVLDVTDEISLKCGSAEVTMKKDGTIVIKGKDITIDGSGKINFKAGGEITAKGAKVNLN